MAVGTGKRKLLKKQIRVTSSAYSGSDERCGDSCGWSELPGGRFAAVLSDGTGKGEAAARDSSRTVNAVLGLLRAGMDPEMALQILNLMQSMSNRKERYPTVDLAVLDTESRELYIYKIGAAPTLIMRAEGKTEILTVPAMPMGVTELAEIASVATLVSAGDRIFMMTDGVADSDRKDTELTWLRRLLGRIKSRNLQTVSDLIIREAALNCRGREPDDMTVLVWSVKP